MSIRRSLLVLIASACTQIAPATARHLVGKYCGSQTLLGMVKLAVSIDCHESRSVASFSFVLADKVYAYDKEVGYTIDDAGTVVIESGNPEFNAFLDSFPIKLSPASFTTKYNKDLDQLSTVIAISFFMSVAVDLSKARCTAPLQSGFYATQSGDVVLDIDTESTELELSETGDLADVITPGGKMRYLVEANGKINFSGHKGESDLHAVKLEQVPGSDAIILMVNKGGRPERKLLSHSVLLADGSATAGVVTL